MVELQGTIDRHVISMTDCNRLSLSGVREVMSFDESMVVLSTPCGVLSVDGENIHISRLDLEIGECDLAGTITGLFYSKARGKGRFFARGAKER